MNLLVLKVRQVKRVLSLVPFPYLCLIVLLAFGLGLIFLNQLRQHPNGYIAVGAYVLFLYVYHGRRRDAEFIKTLYQKNCWLYLLEYTVLSLPLFLLILFSAH